MDNTKFDFFCNCFKESLQKIVNGIPGMELTPDIQINEAEGKILSAIVGVVGQNKGRVHVKMHENLVKKLFEIQNEGPAEDETELCFYLAEFTNMITGNGITMLNNTYKGSDLRLTPPAISIGDNIEVTTPKVQSATKTYRTKFGQVSIVIGFEGV